LSSLSSEYALTREQIQSFRRDGHVLLREVCSPAEIAFYRTAIIETSRRIHPERRPFEERDTFGKAFVQTQNLRLADSRVREFVLARRFARIAAELMGTDGVRIFHDQSLFKEPGQGRNLTPWHQDLYYWPLSTHLACGLWMPLVDVDPDMGGMMFANESHLLGSLGPHSISDESQAHFEKVIDSRELRVVRPSPMRAGDATFHFGWTLHAAEGNASPKTREAMVVSYFADGTRVARPINDSQEHDRKHFLGGRQPDELADSGLNPLVHSRARA